MTVIKLDADRITDWKTFHDVFAEIFGFPDFYGRNLDAWIDCMSSLDVQEDAMTTVKAPPGGAVVLQLEGVDDFVRRCPEQYEALVECAAFVNWRNLEAGRQAVLALAYYKHD